MKFESLVFLLIDPKSVEKKNKTKVSNYEQLKSHFKWSKSMHVMCIFRLFHTQLKKFFIEFFCF